MAGVRKLLTVVMISDTLRLYNQGEPFMARNKLGGRTYFCSKVAHLSEVKKSAPIQQRFRGKTTGRQRRVNGNPARDYFIDSNNHHFGILNHALGELEDKEGKQKAKETEEKERDARVVMSEMSTQTETEVTWDGTDLPKYDGNLLMSFVRLENFIRLATAHSAKYGH